MAMALYKTNRDLTKLFNMFLNSWSWDYGADIEIEKSSIDGPYYAIARATNVGTMRFWIANETFAFASEGTYTTEDGRTQDWASEMPGWLARHRMRKLVREEKNRTGFRL